MAGGMPSVALTLIFASAVAHSLTTPDAKPPLRFASESSAESDSLNPLAGLKAARAAVGSIATAALDAALEFNRDRQCIMCEFLVEMTIQKLRINSELHYAGPPPDFPYTSASAGGVFGMHGTAGQRAARPEPPPQAPHRAPGEPAVRPPPSSPPAPGNSRDWRSSPSVHRPWGSPGSAGSMPGPKVNLPGTAEDAAASVGPGIRSLGAPTGSASILGPLDPNAGVARPEALASAALLELDDGRDKKASGTFPDSVRVTASRVDGDATSPRGGAAGAEVPPHLRADFYLGGNVVELHHAAAAVFLEEEGRVPGVDSNLHEWPGAHPATAPGGDFGVPDYSVARFRAALDAGIDSPETIDPLRIPFDDFSGDAAYASSDFSSADPVTMAEALIRRVEGTLPGLPAAPPQGVAHRRQQLRRNPETRFSQDLEGGEKLSGEARSLLHEASEAATNLAQQLELLRVAATNANLAAATPVPLPAQQSSFPAPPVAEHSERNRFRESLINSDADGLAGSGVGSKAFGAPDSMSFRDPSLSPRFRRLDAVIDRMPASLDEQFAAEADAYVQQVAASEAARARARRLVAERAAASDASLIEIEDDKVAKLRKSGLLDTSADARYAVIDDAPISVAASLANSAVATTEDAAKVAAESAASFTAASRALEEESVRASVGHAQTLMASSKPAITETTVAISEQAPLKVGVVNGAAAAPATQTLPLPAYAERELHAEREARVRQDAAYGLLTGQEIRLQLHEAELAALGAQAPLLSQYPARGRVGPRARKRAAYRLAQSIRFQQFYAVLMDALEDTCGNEIPSSMRSHCRPLLGYAERVADWLMHGYYAEEICEKLRQCPAGFFDS